MTRSEERQSTHRAIVEAATELFLKNGIEKTTIAEIAALAEFSSMSVYRYFGNKQSIVVAVANHLLQAYLAEHRERCVAETKPNESGFDAFSRIIRAYVATYEAHPEYISFLQDMGSYSMREGLTYHLDYMRFGSVQVKDLDRPARDALRAGIADGSVRKDIDGELVGLVLANLLTGGVNFRGLLNTEKEFDIIRHTAEMIIYYTKEQGTANAPLLVK